MLLYSFTCTVCKLSMSDSIAVPSNLVWMSQMPWPMLCEQDIIDQGKSLSVFTTCSTTNWYVWACLHIHFTASLHCNHLGQQDWKKILPETWRNIVSALIINWFGWTIYYCSGEEKKNLPHFLVFHPTMGMYMVQKMPICMQKPAFLVCLVLSWMDHSV